MKLIAGSRGSKLALWQANWVKERLEALGNSVEIRVIATSGDRLSRASLVNGGTKGLFVKEIEEALRDGAVDLAVHSLKDLPVEQPEGLYIAAIPPREDARDALISRDGHELAALHSGARLGTDSPRRKSQLYRLRPDVAASPMRGNLDTRLAKMARGECDGLLLAAAGLHRLGLQSLITQYFSIDEICPAAGQGALAVEIRQDDERVAHAVRLLDNRSARRDVFAERAALERLGGGCRTPIAIHALSTKNSIEILGIVSNPEGTVMVRATTSAPIEEAESAGHRLALELMERGAEPLLH